MVDQEKIFRFLEALSLLQDYTPSSESEFGMITQPREGHTVVEEMEGIVVYGMRYVIPEPYNTTLLNIGLKGDFPVVWDMASAMQKQLGGALDIQLAPILYDMVLPGRLNRLLEFKGNTPDGNGKLFLASLMLNGLSVDQLFWLGLNLCRSLGKSETSEEVIIGSGKPGWVSNLGLLFPAQPRGLDHPILGGGVA